MRLRILVVSVSVLLFLGVSGRAQTTTPTAPILSKDYSVAEKALNKAVNEKDSATLALGLKAFSLEIRNRAVIELTKFDDRSLVVDLLDALKTNQTAMSGGSETEGIQRELNRSIINALTKFTDLKFDYVTNDSLQGCIQPCPTPEIARVMQETKAWIDMNITQSGLVEGYQQIAAKALEKAIQEKDLATMRLGFKGVPSYRFDLEIKLAKAVVEVDDTSFVPDLLEALKRNQGVLSGGSETTIGQALLSRELILAIEHLTNLFFNLRPMPDQASPEKFYAENIVSPKEIEDAITRTEAWLRTSQKSN